MRVTDTLIGRDAETRRIANFLLPSGKGGGGSLVIVGEPGVGKTSLLESAAMLALERGVRVLRASGIEFEIDLPYGGLHQLLHRFRQLIDELPRGPREQLLVALGQSPDGVLSPLALGDALLTFLEQLTDSGPLLLLVDDVQWLDRPSAAVLSFVARRVAEMPIRLLVTSRPAESFFSRAGLEELILAPLDGRAATELLQQAFPSLPPRTRRHIIAEADGNPLALLELSKVVDASRLAAPAEPVLPLTARLRAMFEARIAPLPPVTVRLLLLAALEGTGDVAMLRKTSTGSEHWSEIEPAQDADLITLSARQRVTFRHPLIRSALVNRATESERREAHRELAQVQGVDRDRTVWHLAAATATPDESVAAALEDVASTFLRRGDAVGAVNALLRCAELTPDSDRRGRRLGMAAYVGADVTGDLTTVSSLLSAVGRPGIRAEHDILSVACAAAYALLNGEGDIDSAHRLLVASIDNHLTGEIDEAALWEALLTLLSVCLWSIDLQRLLAFEQLVERVGKPLRRDLKLEVALIADPVRSAPTTLPELDREIATLANETDPIRLERTVRAGTYVDRVSECRGHLWRAVQDGRAGGAVTTAVNALMHLSVDSYRLGRWDEAVQLGTEGLDLCGEYGYRLQEWPFRLALGLTAASRGQHARAEELADQTLQWAAPRGVRGIQLFGWHIRALSALTTGDNETAYANLSRICPAGTFPPLVAYALWIAFDLVDAAVRLGRMDDARRHVDAMATFRVAAISPRLEFATRAAQALASDGCDDALFQSAIERPGWHRWPFELARLHLAYGARLRRARRPTDARQQLGEALDLFRSLAAEPWASQAAAELRAAGAHVHNNTTSSTALTAQEHEIARLAATGLTNKQIAERLALSPRTVGVHLYRIFPKLNVTSRAGLRDALNHLQK